MSEWLPMLLVCAVGLGAVGLGAGVLGGVIGFGTTILLMPPLVWGLFTLISQDALRIKKVMR